MQSRKDQVQAHMFVMGRLTSGVLRLEPDGLDQPVSRTGRGALGGILVAVLACLVVVLFAFIVPGGNTAWKTSGTLVVVKDTGARYLSVDGVLHPVLNLASAKLLAGDNLTVSSMSAKSLKDAPRGAQIGLIGAPDSLPATDALDEEVWAACATRATQATGTVDAGLALALGGASAGSALSTSEAVAVAGPDGADYLLWNGQRLRVDGSNDVLQAIGAGATALPPVTAAFLDVVPAGPDLAVPATVKAGQPGPSLAGQDTRLGQLFADSGSNRYLLTQQGLVPLTPTLFQLYQADPRTQAKAYDGKAITVRQLGPSDLNGHLAPASAGAALTHDNQLPVSMPSLVHLSDSQAVCEQVRSGDSTGTTVLADTGAVTGQAPQSSAGITASCLPAQTVLVEPGHGALVAATLSGGGTGSSYYVVTDGGVKYPVPSSDALTALGYGDVTASAIPVTWLNLLPTGPSLDPATVSADSTVRQSPATTPGCGQTASPTVLPGASGASPVDNQQDPNAATSGGDARTAGEPAQGQAAQAGGATRTNGQTPAPDGSGQGKNP
ncbi:type VII secretion protein EccB [Kineosporia sp. J2-2]|uniref:Type VII secretion protein EccB n=1 Tax=Kineosporia corallincola TaxID=2835133 RepID=A0ABS5TTW8_9ACTN|nr:type VII secretion protein EccB [Kineosporia corallincola]MBT0774252.1 type VII secretion protein EccB [Kineosporia corallincola]